jgi:hypothetical protein
MSAIDKDKKAKVSDISAKKFLMGVSDGEKANKTFSILLFLRRGRKNR